MTIRLTGLSSAERSREVAAAGGVGGGVANEILAAVASGTLSREFSKRLAATIVDRARAIDLATILKGAVVEPDAPVERSYESDGDGCVLEPHTGLATFGATALSRPRPARPTGRRPATS